MTSAPLSDTAPLRAYESPLLVDLGLIHERTATVCDFGPDPGDSGSDSGVVCDPDFYIAFPQNP